ncbi:MAG: hypothetical protein PHG16_06960 [Lachnospiraceae bacterium]|nr:hypothetical protein [Lachnospiraceae bacterium]
MKRLTVILLTSVLVFAGCAGKKEEIPISTNSSSLLTEDDPRDDLEEDLPGEDIPEYEVELPESLSDFTIAIWGENYELPMKYKDFIAMGWSYDGDDTKTIASESYLNDESFEQEGNKILIDLMNPETVDQPIAECYVAGMHIDNTTEDGQAVYVNLPGDIVMQKSSEEEVTTVYGAPIDRYEEDDKIWLTYEYGMNRSVQLGISDDTDQLMQLDIQNFRNPLGEEELDNVSDAVTPEVEAYVKPETAGVTMNQFIVTYAGDLYRLPAPVSAFTDNGWEVKKDESDTAIKNGKYGYVTLKKDDQKIYAVVHNYGTDPTTIRNCFVTMLYGDLDTTKIPISIAGGITLGMGEEEFLTLARDQKYEKTQDKDKACDVYTFYLGDSKADYTKISLDQTLHLVREISVVHNQDAEIQ